MDMAGLFFHAMLSAENMKSLCIFLFYVTIGQQMSYDKKTTLLSQATFSSSPLLKAFTERPLLIILRLNLTLLFLYWLCFCLASCLSLHGIHTTTLAEVFPLFPLIGLLLSPLTRQDNWTCNSDPGIPIRVSLHPLCIECLSYLSVISLWTSLWPLDQREYTILPVQMHFELKILFFFFLLTGNTQYQCEMVMSSVFLQTSSATWTPPKFKEQHLPLQYVENKIIHPGVTLLELFMRGFISKYSTARWSLIIHA